MSTTRSLKYYPWVNKEMMPNTERKKRIKLERDSPGTRESFPIASFLPQASSPWFSLSLPSSFFSFFFPLYPPKSADSPIFQSNFHPLFCPMIRTSHHERRGRWFVIPCSASALEETGPHSFYSQLLAVLMLFIKKTKIPWLFKGGLHTTKFLSSLIKIIKHFNQEKKLKP